MTHRFGKMRPGNALSFGAAIAIGLAVSTGHPVGLAAAAGMPVVCLLPGTRKAAFESTLGYYTAGLWPMIPGLQRYIGSSASPLIPFAIWLFAATLLSMAWTVAWTDRTTEYIWRVPLAFVATTIPPLGIIGFISPLTAAGYLFPSTSWAGLAAVALLPGVLLAARRMAPRLGFAVLCFVFAACTALAISGRARTPVKASTISGWVGVNTHFGDVSQPFRDYGAATFIQEKAAESPARVLIFPEFIVPRWSEATEAFWRRALDRCRERGQVLVIGAGLPSSARMNDKAPAFNFAFAIDALESRDPSSLGTIPESTPSSPESVDNALILLGTSSGKLYQRVPVPIGMWRPFSKVSVPLRLNGPGVIEIDHQRAAVLICYEEMLTFPVLVSILHHPTAIIGISNSFWFDETTIPQYQAAALRSWARLFRLPLFMAVNS
jgi:apolipoprotein N-acyltransferase